MERLSRSMVWWVALVAGIAAVGCGAVVFLQWPTPARNLATAEARWAARPFVRYRMVVESGPACQLDVMVQDEQVVDTFHRSACGHPARSVNDLFSLIERNKPVDRPCTLYKCACRLSITVYASYDDQWGYPQRVAVWSQQEDNWLNSDYWQYVLMFGKLPGCARTSDAEIVRVLSLTPAP
jgi:hypothetical protein